MKAAALVLMTAAAAAGVSGQDLSGTFRGSVDLVALNVVVLDSRQQFVSGLTADNFSVYEDGVRQDVSFFSAGRLPLDVALLLDTSASMRGKLATAQQAALKFVSSLGPGDRLVVMDVKDSSRVLAPLSHDHDAARAAIRGTAAQGNTALYNGVYLTLKEMARQRGHDAGLRRQALVVLSDGDDTSSLVSFDDVLELARQTGIAVYPITLGSELEYRAGWRQEPRQSQSDYAMKALARETGARSFLALRIEDLAGTYASIGQELSSQYSLGYTSTNPRRDGAYRRVSVRIVDRANAHPRTRAGYLAPRG